MTNTTYCDQLIEPLRKKIEAKESLDEIGKHLCGTSVVNPRRKAIRLIKILLGDDVLKQYSESLGYDAKKANRIKQLSTDSEVRNIVTSNKSKDDITDGDSQYAYLISNLRKLIKKTNLQMVKNALLEIEDETE